MRAVMKSVLKSLIALGVEHLVRGIGLVRATLENLSTKRS